MIRVTAAVIKQDNRYLVAQRKHDSHLEYYWEFPGGKIEENESDRECLKRELCEEFSVKSQINEFIGTVNYDYKDFTIELHAYSVKLESNPVNLTSHEKIKWVTLEDLKFTNLAPADKILVELIKE